MALQPENRLSYAQHKDANKLLFEEPDSLAQKRQIVMDKIFGPDKAKENPASNRPYLYGNGSDGNDSKPNDHDDETPPDEAGPTRVETARGQLSQAVDDQHVDPQAYTEPLPEKPTRDTERFHKAKNLTKLSYVAQIADALTDSIGAATSEDYAVAPVRYDQTGIQAYNTLARMDQDHKRRLRRYKKDVFNTKRFNRKARLKASQANQQVDQRLAQQTLEDALRDEEAAQEAEKAKKEAARQKTQTDREAYIDAGNRLITQGQEKAAMVAFSQAGLNGKEIAARLSQQRGGGGGNGGGESEGFDATAYNMYKRFHELQDEIGNNAYDAEGKPVTPKAKEYEFLKDELGRDRYNPKYQKKYEDNKGAGEKKAPATGSEISPQNKQRMEGGLDVGSVKKGFNTAEDARLENRRAVQRIRQATTEKEAKAAIQDWIHRLHDQGFTDQEIKKHFQKIYQ